jgi:hypothetical protein
LRPPAGCGYGEHVERTVEVACLLKEMLLLRGWLKSLLVVLSIEPPPEHSDVRSIFNRVLASGRA